ncbi:hypothetical protein FRB90_010747, partial [Tulasnella sp. 427]
MITRAARCPQASSSKTTLEHLRSGLKISQKGRSSPLTRSYATSSKPARAVAAALDVASPSAPPPFPMPSKLRQSRSLDPGLMRSLESAPPLTYVPIPLPEHAYSPANET